ncbi:MAG: hypothetical protein ABSA51_07655 [Anaerolineaceae bacterium]|jgi:hypothetical protein
MPAGTPVNRTWVVITRDGSYVIDWGDNLFQDVQSGDFIKVKESDISHHPSDEELDWLVHINRVHHYDSRTIYFYNLPERPQHTID